MSTNKNTIISIVMPNYNCARFLNESIESILTQSFKDFEFIIIDDASTDNSWEIIQKYSKQDKRIVALRNQENQKICKTLNRGIEMAKGSYIARMDSDDSAKQNWLEKIFNYMELPENKKVGVCGANFFIINEKGEQIGEKIFPESNDSCKKSFWYRNPFGHNTVLIRRECFSDFGFYDENFLYAEDLELWIRFGQKYDLHNIQEFLVNYRIFGENSIFKKQKLMIKNTLKARRKACEYGYSFGTKEIFFYAGTWMAQWLPAGLVFKIFSFLNKINAKR